MVFSTWQQYHTSVRFQQSITLLRYAQRRIFVNIMKVYIERNNLQLELIRYRKNVYFIHFTFANDGFSAPKCSPAMLAYSLDGSRWSCHAYQHISNTNQFDHCHFQGSTLAVFRYPEHPRFSDGIPDSPEQ